VGGIELERLSGRSFLGLVEVHVVLFGLSIRQLPFGADLIVVKRWEIGGAHRNGGALRSSEASGGIGGGRGGGVGQWNEEGALALPFEHMRLVARGLLAQLAAFSFFAPM